MKKIYALLLLSLFVFSCTEKEQVLEPGTFTIDDSYMGLSFTQDAQYIFVPVTTNVPANEWEISSAADWCLAGLSITGEKGIMVSVESNEDPDARSTTVTAKAGSKSYTLKVDQLGYGPAIVVSDIYVSAAGGTTAIKVTANIEYTVGDPVIDEEDMTEDGAWINKISAANTKALAETSYAYEVQPNYTAGQRFATVLIAAADRSLSDLDATCHITQDIIAESGSSSVVGVAEKIDVVEVKAVKQADTELGLEYNDSYYSKATEAETGGNGRPELLVDGDDATFYSSPRYPASADTYQEYGTDMPFELQFRLGSSDRIEYVNVQAISSTDQYKLKSFNLYYTTSGSDERTLVEGSPFSCANILLNKVSLPTPIEGAEWVIMEVVDAYYKQATNTDRVQREQTLVKLSEVSFYKTNDAEVEEWITTVFTDLSCSELREGVTKKDINEMAKVAPYIAKNVAMPLYQKTYDEEEYEFRSHSYEPYSDPQAKKKEFNIRLYTEYDSPTGVLMESGETYIICVDKIPANQTVSLYVSGDNNSGTEFNYGNPQFSQTLKAGINEVTVAMSGTATEGMAFVVNKTESVTSSSEAVRVHILPGKGTVVGYYDSSKHDDARFKEMIDKYNYKYFFLKGPRILCAYHKNELRKAAPNGMSSGLDALNDVVCWELELMGLDTRTDFNNHLLVASSTGDGVYMDAADRRVRFTVNGISTYVTRESLNESPWGIAHEIGHVNQPAICWQSCVESSNNLFSNLVNYKCGQTLSRGLSLLALAESCGKPWYQLFNHVSLYQNENAELHMRMFWQLWIYFHRCGVNTDFWPTFFENLRQNKTPGMYYSLFGYTKEDPGTCQLMFYEQACYAAQLDLTEFFETWGFFQECNETYGQYGAQTLYYVSSEMVKEYQDRVKAKGYPAAPAIQYIEDRTRQTSTGSGTDPGYDKEIAMGYYTLFENQTTMSTVPSYSLSGRKATITNCDQAAAVEIRDVKGNLLYFSNVAAFEIPEKTGAGDSIDLSTAKWYAVQWDGERKAMAQK